MSTPDRRALLDRRHPELSVRRQCALLSLARSGVYRPVAAADETDLALMRRIDELFLAHPFLGSRRMARMLSRDGAPVNRKRVQRLMRLMGIEALGPKPGGSLSGVGPAEELRALGVSIVHNLPGVGRISRTTSNSIFRLPARSRSLSSG